MQTSIASVGPFDPVLPEGSSRRAIIAAVLVELRRLVNKAYVDSKKSMEDSVDQEASLKEIVQFETHVKKLSDKQTDLVQELYDDVMDLLNEWCPTYCVFGQLGGAGPYGFWPDSEQIVLDDRIYQHQTGRKWPKNMAKHVEFVLEYGEGMPSLLNVKDRTKIW